MSEEIQEIEVNKIVVQKRMRSVDLKKVEDLTKSIKEIGLLQPILISNKNELIAGAHRLEAFKLLNKKKIPIRFFESDNTLNQQLAQIDENLVRSELHYTDQSIFTKKRKEIYEQLHPDTFKGAIAKSGERIQIGKKKGQIKPLALNDNMSVKATPSFIKDTAKKTGKSEKTIERDVKIGESFDKTELELIKEKDLPKTEALELARQKPEMKKKIVEKIKAKPKHDIKHKINIKSISKEIRREEKKERMETPIKEIPEEKQKLYKLIHANITKLEELEDNSINWIITDPPYPKEYLHTFEELSFLANRVLKPNGSCLVLSGQFWLPKVIQMLSKHLTFHWMLSYDLPNGNLQIHPKKVLNQWKPLLWFTKGEYRGEWVKDKIISEQRDKEFHEWGQSESGFTDIIKTFTKKGEIILDPFLGGGTTAIVCIKNDRFFIGSDIDEKWIIKTEERIKQVFGNEL